MDLGIHSLTHHLCTSVLPLFCKCLKRGFKSFTSNTVMKTRIMYLKLLLHLIILVYTHKCGMNNVDL